MSRNAPSISTPPKPPGRPATLDAARVRLELDAALEEWWQQGRLPATALLRDGLFLLQAGHTLEEAQVSLLLRGALAEHKGMVTALRHQTDAERTALILADALLAPPPATLTVAELQRLRREDEGSGGWLAALSDALREETSSADANRRRRALALIEALDAGLPHEPIPAAYALVADDDWPPAAQAAPHHRGLGWLQAALALVLLVGLALAGLWWQQQTRLAGMVTIPAGLYTVSAAAAGSTEPVTVRAFAIDRTEVTVGAYHACIEAGRCPQPASTASATRPNYLLDGAFERFPMINVNWPAASDYCAFVGKRLPSAVEWEVAAGHAPGSERPNPYPWGAQFQLQRANSARTGLGDTQEVGSYRPSGDSEFGAADMAGNVAEWTATNVGRAADSEEDHFLTKGGSFVAEPEELLVAFSAPQPASFAAPWLGFRCALDVGG